ncbi:hypothetical protein [Flavihumibacter sp. CACIAM 22H1]|uniref:hypothetical protein n=1 Tax=Flavihumibacter sp. CACIAM 22H1 TaxID=1812911 RepID=UPI0007A7EC9D|nr:hypothetical protein [Flavihumibacter sp. CACIAM 22H1]KYP16611.1 MAG: hypothetical protein A1D16_09360 [Flavihumibacter sp. CACIAM 22H1]
MNFPIHKAANALATVQDSTQLLTKLTDLEYAQPDNTDPRWQRLPSNTTLNLQFNRLTKISELQLTALRYTISSYYPPAEVEVLGSIKKAAAFIQGRNKISYKISFPPTNITQLRIKLSGVDPIPAGHFAAGGKSWLLLDELVIN